MPAVRLDLPPSSLYGRNFGANGRRWILGLGPHCCLEPACEREAVVEVLHSRQFIELLYTAAGRRAILWWRILAKRS